MCSTPIIYFTRQISMIFMVACLLFSASAEKETGSFGYLSKNKVHFISLGKLLRTYDLDVAKAPSRYILKNGPHQLEFAGGSSYVRLNGEDAYLRQRCFESNGDLYIPIGGWIDLMPAFFPEKSPTLLKVPKRIQTIVIDPGHGGKDNGAVANGKTEKHIVLEISKRLMRELRRQGFDVKLTRYSDIFISLEDRVNMADHLKADLLLSMHCNSSRSKNARGVEVFSLSSVQRHRRLRSTLDQFPGERYFYRYLSQNFKRTTSHLSEVILDAFRIFPGYRIRGIKHADFRVLKKSGCPAFLIEMGFVTNVGDARLLGQKSELDRLAVSLAQNIRQYSDKQHRMLDA